MESKEGSVLFNKEDNTLRRLCEENLAVSKGLLNRLDILERRLVSGFYVKDGSLNNNRFSEDPSIMRLIMETNITLREIAKLLDSMLNKVG